VIKYFTVENFYSIKHESILEFDLNMPPNFLFLAQPTIGFAGANASGKSTILKALTFTLWFASQSFLKLDEIGEIPVEYFITNKENPCKFHIIFNIQGIDYEYILAVYKQKVLTEEFYYYPKKRKKFIYKRKNKSVTFGEGVHKIETLELRDNSSIISYAAQFDSQIFAKSVKEYNNFPTNIPAGKQFREIKFKPALVDTIIKNPLLKEKTIEFLRLADVGINDFFIEKNRQELLAFFEKMQNEGLVDKMTEESKAKFMEEYEKIKDNEGAAMIKAFFKHSIDGQSVDFEAKEENESAGTLQAFALFVNYILEGLEKGLLVIIDEIELKIHQNLVAYMIGLFQNSEVNTKNAQLIFSFHNTAFMEILSPEQLWFAEKNEQGHSDFYCAANVTGIPDLYKKNLETLYRIGRFGAKPKFL